MKISVSKVWLFGVTVLIFGTPINIFGVRLLNEPIILVSLTLSLAVLWSGAARCSIAVSQALVVGAAFSAFFLLILLWKFPEIFVLKDAVECFKPLIYSIIFGSGVVLSRRYEDMSLERYIIIAGLVSVAFSFLVYLPPLHPFVDLFKARQSIEANNFHFYRFSGTLGYPGGFGYWLVLALHISLLGHYKGTLCGRRFVIAYGFMLIGLILTGSRGAFAIYALLTSITLLSLPMKKVSWKMGLLFISAVVAFVSFLLSAEVDIQAIMHFQKVLEDPTGGTFAHRASELERAYEVLAEGHMFGMGPNNLYIQSTYGPIESAYYFYGYKFGLVGLTFYFLLVCLCIRIAWCFFKARLAVTFGYFFALWALLNLVVAGVSNSITEEYKSFYLFFLLLGFSFGYLQRIHNHRACSKICYNYARKASDNPIPSASS